MENKEIKENEITVPSSWIPFSRDIASLYKKGFISKKEYFVYLHLRLQCNPYGVCSAHLGAIRDDVFGKDTGREAGSKNYVNKLLLSLKRKKLLFYNSRVGQTGSFDVYFPDFITPAKQITSITHLFEAEYSMKASNPQNNKESEVSTEVGEKIQRLEKPKNEGSSTNNLPSENKQFRGYNNDTDTQNEIEKSDISVSFKGEGMGKIQTPYKCKNPTDSFAPNGYEEQTALTIAIEIGEKCIDRYLALIKQGHFWALEKAYGEYKEGRKVSDDPPAYLNAIICRLLKKEVGK